MKVTRSRASVVLAALFVLVAYTPAAAQQALGPSSHAAPAPTSSGRTPLAGPRLQPQWRSVQPAFTDSSASATPVSGGTHTITVTTLVLVLVVIIAVLLIAK